MLCPSSSRSSSSAITRPMFGMNGNGCAGSIASGVSTGNTRSMNQASSQFTSSADSSLRLAHLDAGLAQQAAQFAPDPLLLGEQRLGAELDLGELLRRRAAVGRDRGDAGLGLADQAGDAHRIELVQVGGADRDEAQPFQQRMARVLRLLQHAVVEVEPGQLAVDEAVGAVRRDRGRVGWRPLGRAVQHVRRTVAARQRLPDAGAVFMRDPTGEPRLPARGAPSDPEISSGASTSARTRAANGTVILRCWSSATASRRATASRSAAALRGRRRSSHSCTGSGSRSCRSASSRASSARSSVVLRRADLHRGHGAQPAGEIGQPHRPAGRRQAGGEQHRQPGLARRVQQMQQRALVGDGVGVIERDAGGGQVRQPGQFGAGAQLARRCAPPRCAAGGSCRGPPRPTAPGDGSATPRCGAARRTRRHWMAPGGNRLPRSAARGRSTG